MKTFDAQAALAFVINQNSYIESQVYEIKYPDIRYSRMIPVDTSANPFVKTVTYYSSDKFGKADWINGNADDIPKAGTERTKYETSVYTAAIGYGWGFEEVNQAQSLGINLPADDARAARRAYEEMVDRVALFGDAEKGFEGLYNNSNVTANAATNGDWPTATPLQINQDINDAIGNIYTTTNTVGIANTLVLPFERYNYIASTPMSASNPMTILNFVQANNIYTATTGQPLMIIGERGLIDAATGSSPSEARMVAYRRDPEVLKLHLPMPLQFQAPWQSGPLRWDVPGVFRLGGLDIRLPKEVTYVDGV